MFRNQYDHDVSIWSPQGRIHQIEYAMEAVKQGSVAVGIKSETHVVLVALKRSSDELSSYQKKIYPIDDHVAVAIAGLTSDGRMLGKFMRTECLNSRYSYNMALPVSRLVAAVGSKTQWCTQAYGRRPYGVGMLVAGYDDKGAHLYQTCPSSNYYDCRAMAIGSRSQSARTYLENKLSDFGKCNLEELIQHSLIALRESLPNDMELTEKNISIAVVGEGKELEIYDDEKVAPFLKAMDSTKGGRTARKQQEEEQQQADSGSREPGTEPGTEPEQQEAPMDTVD